MVIGGAILGAGGGGTIADGLQAGRDALALGSPRMFTLAEIAPEAQVVTLSGVGGVQSQSSAEMEQDFVQALKLFRRHEPMALGGLIASEVGPRAVTYGWGASLLTGIPLIDAPCNGRAHPLGTMGSLGLQNLAGYCPLTVAIARKPQSCSLQSEVFRDNVVRSAARIRQLAKQSGGSVAVVRNPVPASYLRNHAAVGGVKRAAELGRLFLAERQKGLANALEALAIKTNGEILMQGRIQRVVLKEDGGFTFGTVRVVDEYASCHGEIAVCNEALQFTRNRVPLATFPDVITVFDVATRLPLNTGAMQAGQQVVVFQIPRRSLLLGSTMYFPALSSVVKPLIAKANRLSK